MSNPDFFILYVDDPVRSADFYAKLLDKEPLEASATFAMFSLDSGVTLGLWSKHTVKPVASMTGGGGEIAFPVRNAEAVQTLYRDWMERDIPVLLEPVSMSFGYTFVALDPDEHRLRVFSPFALEP